VDPRHYTGITGGPEATDGVFESGASIVPDQAENRLYAIRAKPGGDVRRAT
jgi:ornithine carbamoyltransferase